MEKIYGMHRLVGLQLFLSGTPTFSSGTPTFCQMGVLNSCFQNPSESSAPIYNPDIIQGCGNTMPDLSDLVPFHSGQVENFNLLVLGQVQNLYKVNKNFVFHIFINSHVALKQCGS